MILGQLDIIIFALLNSFTVAFFFAVKDIRRASNVFRHQASSRNNRDDALQHLGLTPHQISAVLQRQPSYNHSTLCWLTSRFSQKQAIAIIVGHPPILNYNVQTNLDSTVEFYQNSLETDMVSNDNMDINLNVNMTSNNTRNIIGTRLALFLSESPGLFEYNVKKRLIPRFKRVQTELEVRRINEECLRAIATKTDSRFVEWLEEMKGVNIDGNNKRAKVFDSDVVKRTPSSHIVVSNLQSGGNIGNILRSASIFGCEECIVVGQKRHRLTGEHGSRLDLRRCHMWSHIEAKEYLHERGVRIYGIEIMTNASPIMKYDPETGVVHFPFDRQWQGAAFVMGNEGNGLSIKQREICDEFLYIPQTRGGRSDGGGSASLNVACAATVILQAYCMWASYPDADRNGEKFVAKLDENNRL